MTKAALLLSLALLGCHRETPVRPVVDLGMPCGPSYIYAATKVETLEIGECQRILRYFEIARQDYVERRVLTTEQRSRLAAMTIRDVTIYKENPIAWDTNGDPLIMFGEGFMLAYFLMPIRSIVYGAIDALPHEFCHFFEFVLFGPDTAACIGHKNYDPERCAELDPFNGFVRRDL